MLWKVLRFTIELVLFAPLFITLAILLAILISGIRMYYGPWADPPGSDFIGSILIGLALLIAASCTVRRHRVRSKPSMP